MFRKLALGLFAAASLGVLALTPSTASAKGWGWGGGFHHHHFGHFPGFGVAYVGVEQDGPAVDGVTDDTVVGTLGFSF